jgi:hypothetical protein
MDSTVGMAMQGGRIRSVLMVLCALALFLAGLLLLFAPASAQGDDSRFSPAPFPGGANGWIMGAHSPQSESVAGA